MPKTILYVDDEPWFTQALVDALRDNEYVVELSVDGTEAVERLTEENIALPDLVILDVIMPTGKSIQDKNGGRRTGLKVHEIIRKQFRLRMPIIFLTVVDDPMAKQEIENLEKSQGVNSFGILVKPVLPSELLDMVSALLKPLEGK
jgi:CheY-like chemotaxis protein